MSKFKVKGVLDDVIKFVEFTRGSQITVAEIRTKLEKKFNVGSLTLRFRSANGQVQACYQDFHVQDALTDSLKAGLKDVVFLLTKESPSYYAPTSTSSAPSTITRKPSFTASKTPSFTSPSSPPSTTPIISPTKPIFCESCGNTMSPSARFCSSCGTTREVNEPGRAPIPTSSSSASIKGSSNEKTCSGCGRSLGSSGLKALERMWHKECFNCAKCKNSLLNSAFVENDGVPLCGNCYDDLHAKKCTKCKRAISGAFLNVEGFDYHKECFVCATCHNQFTAGYFMKNGEPTCDKCV